MLYTTKGVVLSYIKFRDTSIIAKIFTEELGLQSYIIHSVRTQKPKHGIGLFQSLALLDMVVYHKKDRGLQSIKELKCLLPTYGILNNLKKSTIAVFIAEVLAKVIHEGLQHKQLFSYIVESVIQLSDQTTGYEYNHINFMLQLCKHLGFGVSNAHALNKELSESGLSSGVNDDEVILLDVIYNGSYPAILSRTTICNLMHALITFYRLHIDNFYSLKSLPLLLEVIE